MLNIAKIAHDSTIYGPGTRTVIWFQGCSIKCKGCINPKMIPFCDKHLMKIGEVIERVKSDKVTLLGGEPLDQLDIYDLLEELSTLDIEVVLFTGYEWKDIEIKYQKIIQSSCQFVVLGPYIESFANHKLYLRGSDNQEIRILDKNIKVFDELEAYEILINEDVEVRGRVTENIFDIIEN